MAEISPFQGIRYNQQIIKDMAAVICPPYDIISPEEQQGYYQKSDYNIIRLEHGMKLPEDQETSSRHNRARNTFVQWLKDGILQVDTIHTFYIYEQGFTYKDTKKKRRGLIACVMLESWENNVVFPHENTVPGIKSDRLDLMRACNANISPIMGLYEDPGQKIAKLMLEKMKPSKLLIDITQGGETHKVWKANEPEFVQRVSYFMSPKPIYIADGHHRYETALAYRDERRQASPSYRGDEAFNFIMMTLIPFSDPGLVVLPIHRLVRGIPPETLLGLKDRLSEFFEIVSSPLKQTELKDERNTAIRILGLEPGNVLNLMLRQSVSLDDIMPEHRSGAYKKLEVSIVEHLIMGKMLGCQGGSDAVSYTADPEEVGRLVEDGQYQIAFLLNPLPVSSIKEIADANDRMPGKSTYFYPKLPTGLVVNRLDGRL